MHRFFIAANAILFAGLFVFSINAQSVNLTGSVKNNSTQAGIANATVTLAKQPLLTVQTDASGNYVLTGSSVRFFKSAKSDLLKTPYSNQNRIFFGVPNGTGNVQIDLFDLCGRHISQIVNTSLTQGNYQLNPFRQAFPGKLYFVKIRIAEKSYTLRMPYVNNTADASLSFMGGDNKGIAKSGLSKIADINDTLIVSAPGYATARKAITAYTGANNFLMTPKAGSEGSISLENGSYSGCQTAMVVTVQDSDLTAQTVSIKVKSTTDPTGITLILKRIDASSGTYSDSAFFNINKSDSALRRIKVKDQDGITVSYAEASPARLDTAAVVWSGTLANVNPGMSIYTGVLNKFIVNVYDPDVTDSFVTVNVSSNKDKTGINAKLPMLAGSPGSFSGKVGFSIVASQGDSVIGVTPAQDDNIIIKYHDLTPEQDVLGSICTWKPSLAAINLDSTAYHGTTGKMTITLADDDISDSTVVVNVKSKKSTAGISTTLKTQGGVGGIFVGQIGFSTSTSSTGFIAVQANDSVTVSYQDDSPVQLVTKSASWNTN